MKEGMIKVIVGYPSGDGTTFDRDYYINKHMPIVHEKMDTHLKGVMVEFGLGSAAPGSEAPYQAIATMYFENMESFGEAFGASAGDLMADIPNFTNTEPVIQISEIAYMKAG